MRKFIFSLVMALMAIVSVNAQTAVQTSKLFDNTYIGVTAGATTPLDFNSVFPVNPVAGLKFGKEFCPILAIEVEGVAILNDNHWTDIKTAVKGTNVGLNGIVNLSNLFGDYNGTPRTLEFKTNTGLGWMHVWNTSANAMTAKTGLDLQFNFGKTKAHSFIVTPAVYWNLSKFGGIKFDKRGAQFGLTATYLYHFKTSNGTRHFKTYDVGAMINEIDRLNSVLAECEKREPKVVEKIIIKEAAPATDAVAVANDEVKWIVTFAENSSVLTPEAMYILNQIGNDAIVDIVATASMTGSDEYNQKLSEKRAAVVSDYLTNNRGVRVNSAVGKGKNAETGRVAIVTNTK